MDKHSSIREIKLRQLVEGECFLCFEPCKPTGYVHSSCAIAYEDEKHKRIREQSET